MMMMMTTIIIAIDVTTDIYINFNILSLVVTEPMLFELS